MSESQRDDLLRLIGHQIRLTKKGKVLVGVLKGESLAVTIDPVSQTAQRMWVLLEGTNETHFYANDGWSIVDLQ